MTTSERKITIEEAIAHGIPATEVEKYAVGGMVTVGIVEGLGPWNYLLD